MSTLARPTLDVGLSMAPQALRHRPRRGTGALILVLLVWGKGSCMCPGAKLRSSIAQSAGHCIDRVVISNRVVNKAFDCCLQESNLLG